MDNTNYLNETVEILDNEPEEIEELPMLIVPYHFDGIAANIEVLNKKINELVRAVNQMRKEKE